MNINMNTNEINVKITHNYLIKLNTFKLRHTALEYILRNRGYLDIN